MPVRNYLKPGKKHLEGLEVTVPSVHAALGLVPDPTSPAGNPPDSRDAGYSAPGPYLGVGVQLPLH